MTEYLLLGRPTGFLASNFERVKNTTPLTPVMDCTNSAQMRTLFDTNRQVPYCIYLADHQQNYMNSTKYPFTSYIDNLKMHTSVIDAWFRSAPSMTFLTVTSGWAYPEDTDVLEESRFWDRSMHAPTRAYGLTKRVLQEAINAVKQERSLMKGTTFALSNVYGPGDNYDATKIHLIPSLIKQMAANPDNIELHGTGFEYRDFIYVNDVVNGIDKLRDCNLELVNIASGQPIKIDDLAYLIADLMHYRGKITFNGIKSGIPVRQFDTTLAKSLGLEIKTSLERGLSIAIEDYTRSQTVI